MPHIFLDATTVDWKTTIFNIVGGLGIFLYGINMMSNALKKLAGAKLKMILEKTTNTPLKGILVGIFITAIIQSSSATSALVVGLVRAGLMTLPQAVGVIFGANIGTTFTSVLISLNLDEYAMPIMFIGSFLIFFFRRKKVNQAGQALLGFGMLFFGLETMGSALKTLTVLPGFKNMIASVTDTPILGVFVGVLTTAIIQSSSATIGILQQLFSTGTVPIIGAIAIVLGDNIGTTLTSVLASIGGSKQAKRTALVHVTFNMIGTVIFFILLRPYSMFIDWMASRLVGAGYETSKFTISLAHVTFNLVNVFIMYWFIKQLIWLVYRIIPARNEIEGDDIILDNTLLKESPDLALENVKNAVINMGNVTKAMLEYTYNFAFKYDLKDEEMGQQCEEIIDTMDDKIHNYLVAIGSNDLTDAQTQLVAKNIDTISDIERIGDHLDNLLEFFSVRHEKKMVFHKETKEELENLFDIIRNTINNALEAYANKDKDLAKEVNVTEDTVDKLVLQYRRNYINRINDKANVENEAGFYVDILSNMERISDHCNNIAMNVIFDIYAHDDPQNSKQVVND